MHLFRTSLLALYSASCLATTQNVAALRLSKAWAHNHDQFKLTSQPMDVELSDLRFTQDSVSDSFSAGQIDTEATARNTHHATGRPVPEGHPDSNAAILDRWATKGIELKAKGVLGVSSQKGNKNKKHAQSKKKEFLDRPVLTVTKVIGASVTLEARDQQVNHARKQPAATVVWPAERGEKVFPPVVGTELLIKNMQRNKVHLTDDELLIKDAIQVLRSVRDELGVNAADALASPKWKDAVRRKIVPHFATLKVVLEDVDAVTRRSLPEVEQKFWSLDNRRLHCLKEVFVNDALAAGVEEVPSQKVTVKVFKLSDMLRVSHFKEDSDEKVARFFFSMKSDIHGLVRPDGSEYGRISINDSSHRASDAVRNELFQAVRAQCESNKQPGRLDAILRGDEVARGYYGENAAGKVTLVRPGTCSSRRLGERSRAIARDFPLRAVGGAAGAGLKFACGDEQTVFVTPCTMNDFRTEDVEELDGLLDDIATPEDWDNDENDCAGVITEVQNVKRSISPTHAAVTATPPKLRRGEVVESESGEVAENWEDAW